MEISIVDGKVKLKLIIVIHFNIITVKYLIDHLKTIDLLWLQRGVIDIAHKQRSIINVKNTDSW